MKDRTGYWTLANAITLIRLLLTLPVGYLILTGESAANLPALFVFLLAALSDGVDGYVARSRGEISKLGQLLDPVADKALGITVFAALVVIGALPAWAFWILAAKEALLVLGGLVMLGRGGRVVPARFLGKVTTVALFGGMAVVLVGLQAIGQGLVVVGVALSLLAAIDYANQVRRV